LIDQEQLLDDIYEAAVIPELWPNLLHSIAKTTKAEGGVLFAADIHENVTGVASAGLQELVSGFVSDGWMRRNSRPVRCLEKQLTGFIGDYDLFSDAEMDQDPLYAYLRHKGYGWCSGMLAPLPTGDVVVVNFERAYRNGAFSRSDLRWLNQIRPHLTRSALMANRIGLEKARAATSALNVVNLAAGVVKRGRLYAANLLLQSFIPSVILDNRKAVSLTNAGANKILQNALSSSQRSSGEILSIPIPGTTPLCANIIHLIPLKKGARDLFWSADFLIVLTPITPGTAPAAQILQGLFDLTPAEAKLANGLASGVRLEDLAEKLGVKTSTLRTQLKSVFLKAGVQRQAELVSLLVSQPVKLPKDQL
jgi:DNA-binding CsgD family transcriptional regulator